MIGQHIGAIGHMFTPAEADLEMHRAVNAEKALCGNRAFFGHGDLR